MRRSSSILEAWWWGEEWRRLKCEHGFISPGIRSRRDHDPLLIVPRFCFQESTDLPLGNYLTTSSSPASCSHPPVSISWRLRFTQKILNQFDKLIMQNRSCSPFHRIYIQVFSMVVLLLKAWKIARKINTEDCIIVPVEKRRH